MNQQTDLPEEKRDDEDDFGIPDPREKPPFWKRELLFGYSLPWLLGVGLLTLASLWYLFGPPLSFTNNTPSDSSFSEVENTLGNTPQNMTSPPSHEAVSIPATMPPAQPSTPVIQSDKAAMMTDIRDELNDRDSKLNDSLKALKESVALLSDAIKRDEAYALETRNQLTDLTHKLAMLEARASTAEVSRATTATKRQPASAVSGMKIMSLETGMAWIKWQGSTWSVREGDTLGNVTVRQIDPVTRSVVTTGGTLH